MPISPGDSLSEYIRALRCSLCSRVVPDSGRPTACLLLLRGSRNDTGYAHARTNAQTHARARQIARCLRGTHHKRGNEATGICAHVRLWWVFVRYCGKGNGELFARLEGKRVRSHIGRRGDVKTRRRCRQKLFFLLVYTSVLFLLVTFLYPEFFLRTPSLESSGM